MDHFTAWRAAERFFAEYFGFLFDNMCRCYLVFVSLYPLLFASNYCCVMIKLWLRVVCILGIAYIYLSAHILFEYKLVLVFFEIRGLKHGLFMYIMSLLSNTHSGKYHNLF